MGQQMKPLLTVICQMPVHMSVYIAVRTMYSSYPDFKFGGSSWFLDLTQRDPYRN